MATNRVITYKGHTAQLKNHPSLRLQRNEHSRTIGTQWKGLLLYFTAEKGKNKKGEISVVFIVSSLERKSKEYVSIYLLRWGIEMFFRTAKQSLGCKDCQSTDLPMQKQEYTISFMLMLSCNTRRESSKLLTLAML